MTIKLVKRHEATWPNEFPPLWMKMNDDRSAQGMRSFNKQNNLSLLSLSLSHSISTCAPSSWRTGSLGLQRDQLSTSPGRRALLPPCCSFTPNKILTARITLRWAPQLNRGGYISRFEISFFFFFFETSEKAQSRDNGHERKSTTLQIGRTSSPSSNITFNDAMRTALKRKIRLRG